jgi:hypothetical protein
MQLLWSSDSSQLNVGGKYNHATIANGVVFVGTDRIQAFGINPTLGARAVRINSGDGAVGEFLADTYFAGGHSDTFTNPVDVTDVTNPAPVQVYQSKRTDKRIVILYEGGAHIWRNIYMDGRSHPESDKLTPTWTCASPKSICLVGG